MNIINDTSSQTTITTYPAVTGTYNPLITSNDLVIGLATKQNTLTGSTTLLGIGSSITALNYNNITLNLPSTFPSDWSTLANKPTTFNPDLTNVYTKSQVDNISALTNFYTKSSTDTLLSAKQPTLTATMTLAGIGSNLTLINYNTLSNLPNLALKENVLTFNSPLSRVGNTISLDLSTYLTSNSASNIFYTITNATTALATKEAILTFNSPFSRVGNTISLDLSTYLTSNSASNIFYTITNATTALATKENILTFSAPLVRTTNTITLDLSTYLTSNSASNIFDTIAARNAALANYLPLAGGSMTGALTINNNINITGSATNSLIFDNVTNNKKIQLNTTNGLGVATNGLIFYTSGGLAIKDSTLSTTIYSVDSAGSMSTNGTIYPNGGLSTIGNVSANTFTENGTLLSNKYLTQTNAGTTYLTQTSAASTYLTQTNAGTTYLTQTNAGTTYLKLDGSSFMTGPLQIISSQVANQIVLTNNAGVGYSSIRFFNGTQSGYIGIGGTQVGGTYQTNLYIEATNSIIFATGGANTTTTPPRMIITSGGGVGINTTVATGAQFEVSDGTNKIKIGGTNGGAHHMTTNNAFVFNTSVVGGTIAIFRNLANGYDNLSGYNDRMTITSTGVDINQTLTVGTTSTFNGSTYFKTNIWHYSTDSKQRLYFSDNSTTYIQGQSTTPIIFRNNANADLGNFSSAGDFTATASISTGASSYLYAGGLRIGGMDTGNTLWQSTGNLGISANTGNNITFAIGNGGEKMRINNFGNVGIGTAIPRAKLDVYDNAIIVRGTNEAAVSGIYISNPFVGDSALKTAIISQGITSFSRSKLHLCNNNNADNTTSVSVSDARLTVDTNGSIGVNNLSPCGMLTVGNSSLANSEGHIVIGRKDGGGGTRQYRLGYTAGWSAVIGDYGNNNTAATQVEQFRIIYTAPTDTLVCYGDGNVGTKYGYVVTASDERLKTDISTIENALDKVLHLRGVNFTYIQEGKKSIGLIAQEVENIIPEVVFEYDGVKAISYANIVGVLIEAMKEQQQQIAEMKTQINFLLNK